MKKRTHPLAGFYRYGRTYFRAVYVKSRRAFRLYWLTPGGEVRSRNLYPPETVEKSRRLKNRPARRTLSEAWLIK